MSEPTGGLSLSITGTGQGRRLRVLAPSAAAVRDFDGTASDVGNGTVLEGPLSAANAAAVRTHHAWLQPQPVGLVTSAGVGDRLGLATPGHVRAFRRYGAGIVPVFAQQSIREMDRLGRTPQHVLDDATFGCLQAGWDSAVGADADHLKSAAEIDRCLAAGFTSFTLDPGEHVRSVTETVSETALGQLPWRELEDDQASMLRRYSGRVVEIGQTPLHLDEKQIRRAAAKYGAAVAHTVAMYRHLLDRATYPVEVEIAVDETAEPTTLTEHVYLATEMSRLGMLWVGFAPRYVGQFEKGVDYIGDKDLFRRSLAEHAQLAQVLGPYKLSLHSGSDKFSIYAEAAEATDRVVHLKTSGTSYLEALSTAATEAPELFREIYALSREAYRGAKASYQVSAQLERTPVAAGVPDEQLEELVRSFDSRQILHVGYGAVLTSTDEHGARWMSDALRQVLDQHSARYETALETHLGAHLQPFAASNR